MTSEQQIVQLYLDYVFSQQVALNVMAAAEIVIQITRNWLMQCTVVEMFQRDKII